MEVKAPILGIENKHLRTALLIRKTEELLFKLATSGEISGTIHVCIGQELAAVAICSQLEDDDFVVSNHRCHGHYIAFTGDYQGLISEVLGVKSGVCGGIGGSQHLCGNNFYSNGIQGGMVPVAAGMALAGKMQKGGLIGVVCIGDGTLGQGIVYETLNIIAKWNIPLLILLENNNYAQSTHQDKFLAGSIKQRFESYGIESFSASTWQAPDLFAVAKEAISYVRCECKPAVCIVDTYRLYPHSRSDDYRDKDEIESYRQKDLLEKWSKEHPLYNEMADECTSLISKAYARALKEEDYTSGDEYFEDRDNSQSDEVCWSEVSAFIGRERFVKVLNSDLRKLMNEYDNLLLVGEDIDSPYGGAFKVSEGLSDEFRERVFTTPISESAITGICNGLALKGFRPFCEIMFGDFVTLAMDQLLNHAAKFRKMFNNRVRCPIVLRTPMGGGRGYGATHSQTLDKILFGVDGLKLLALNLLLKPYDVYKNILEFEDGPVVVIENKLDYSCFVGLPDSPFFSQYTLRRSSGHYPTLKYFPNGGTVDVTIISYGGCIKEIFNVLELLFYKHDILAELIVLTQLHPLPLNEIVDAVDTSLIVTVEEGSEQGGIGNAVIAGLCQYAKSNFRGYCIGAEPVPIPASRRLEDMTLPSTAIITTKIVEFCHGT